MPVHSQSVLKSHLGVFRAVDDVDEFFDPGLGLDSAALSCFASSGVVFVVLSYPRAALRG
jgi:hypothetical protein